MTPVRRQNYFSARLYKIIQLPTISCLAWIVTNGQNAFLVIFISLLPWSDGLSKNYVIKLKEDQTIFLRRFSSIAATNFVILFHFFTISFEHSIPPPAWLTAFLTPLFKKGKSIGANNYRPIALRCTMCKLMEANIKNQMVQFLVDKGLINKH
jgi:hypothetical protein